MLHRKNSAVLKSTRKDRDKVRILLVDDDERNLLALSEVLDDLAEVVCVTSGRDALRVLLKSDFAVILLDVFMPGMDGYEAAGLIRAREQTAKIPIIFLSAVNKETEHLRRGYEMGAVDYVFKPVDPMMLKSKVSVFVDLYAMRLRLQEQSRAEQRLRDDNYKAEIERLRIVRELEQSRARQAAILDALPIALFEGVVDADGLLQRRFVGGDLMQLAGLNALSSGGDEQYDWESKIHPDDLERASRIGSSLETVTLEYRRTGEDGEVRHFFEQCVRVGGDDATDQRWAGTLLDVTAQKRLEEQLVQAGKMEAIGQLTGGVAHDFNNLLAAVLGGIHVLERRLTMGEREKMIVDQMRHAAEHGAELVRRMMAFARKQDLSPTSVDPGSLCRSVAGLVEHTLGGNVEIDWQCPNSGSNLFVDKSQLELALLNLILNARDAMPDGGKLTVAIADLDSEELSGQEALPAGNYLKICVTDEGSGIPDAEIEKITQPFYTTKEAGKGTGLGLSMVLGLVQQSGGRLHISSTVGEGTTIEMILPSTPHPELVAAKSKRVLGPVSARSILLVDDDDAVRTVVGEQLRELGFDVVATADGASAIIAVEDGIEFDLLLSDFAMPGMNGIQTINRIKSMRPDIRSALMTGYADDRLSAIDRGAIAVFRKPIDLDDLLGFLSA
ncbi:MAG: response regulator [Pseudomonadota bacterium]|nr:response regulator [Pseudomonadota bacterium]